jgi:hypothetical protein
MMLHRKGPCHETGCQIYHRDRIVLLTRDRCLVSRSVDRDLDGGFACLKGLDDGKCVQVDNGNVVIAVMSVIMLTAVMVVIAFFDLVCNYGNAEPGVHGNGNGLSQHIDRGNGSVGNQIDNGNNTLFMRDNRLAGDRVDGYGGGIVFDFDVF